MTLTVARAKNGRLMCPADAPEAEQEWLAHLKQPLLPPPDFCNTRLYNLQESQCGNKGCSKRVFEKGQCATFKLSEGCRLVREKMKKEDENARKTCGPEAEYGHASQFANPEVPQVDILYEQCLSLYKCATPSDKVVGGGECLSLFRISCCLTNDFDLFKVHNH